MNFKKKILASALCSLFAASAIAMDTAEPALTAQAIETPSQNVIDPALVIKHSHSEPSQLMLREDRIIDTAESINLSLPSDMVNSLDSINEQIAIRRITNEELEAIDGAQAGINRFGTLSVNQRVMGGAALTGYSLSLGLTKWLIPSAKLNRLGFQFLDALVCNVGIGVLDVTLGMSQLAALRDDGRAYGNTDVIIAGVLGFSLPALQSSCTLALSEWEKAEVFRDRARKANEATQRSVVNANVTRGLKFATELAAEYKAQDDKVKIYLDQAKVHRKALRSHITAYRETEDIRKNCFATLIAWAGCRAHYTNVLNAIRKKMSNSEANINKYANASASVVRKRAQMVGTPVTIPRLNITVKYSALKTDFSDE